MLVQQVSVEKLCYLGSEFPWDVKEGKAQPQRLVSDLSVVLLSAFRVVLPRCECPEDLSLISVSCSLPLHKNVPLCAIDSGCANRLLPEMMKTLTMAVNMVVASLWLFLSFLIHVAPGEFHPKELPILIYKPRRMMFRSEHQDLFLQIVCVRGQREFASKCASHVASATAVLPLLLRFRGDTGNRHTCRWAHLTLGSWFPQTGQSTYLMENSLLCICLSYIKHS